jgi:hypothetical protein
MSDHDAKQRAYEAKRPKLVEQYPTIEYRVFMPDGREFIERAIGMSVIVAHYPQAWRVERVSDGEKGNFW